MSDVLRMQRGFSSSWPAVLEEIQDYIHLQLMAAGHWRAVEIDISLSRQLVRAEQLQPHVDTLRAHFSAVENGRLVLKATDAAEHRVDLTFWR